MWFCGEASCSKTLRLKLPMLIRKVGISNDVAFKANHKTLFSHIHLLKSSLSYQAELSCLRWLGITNRGALGTANAGI